MGEVLVDHRRENERALVSYCGETLPRIVRDANGGQDMDAVLPFGGNFDIDSVRIQLASDGDGGFEHVVEVKIDSAEYLPEVKRVLGREDYTGVLRVRAIKNAQGESEVMVEIPYKGGAKVVGDVAVAAELVNTTAWWSQNNHDWKQFSSGVRVLPKGEDHTMTYFSYAGKDNEMQKVCEWYNHHFGLLRAFNADLFMTLIAYASGQPVKFSVVEKTNYLWGLWKLRKGAMFFDPPALAFLDAGISGISDLIDWDQRLGRKVSADTDLAQMFLEKATDEVMEQGVLALNSNGAVKSLLGLRMEVGLSSTLGDTLVLETNTFPLGVAVFAPKWRGKGNGKGNNILVPQGKVEIWDPRVLKNPSQLYQKGMDLRGLMLGVLPDYLTLVVYEKLKQNLDLV